MDKHQLLEHVYSQNNKETSNIKTMEKDEIENQTRKIVEQYYQNLTLKNYEANVNLFAEQVEWRIPGNAELVGYIKNRHTKAEIRNYYRELNENLEPLSFNITEKFFNGEKAVVTGHMSNRMLSTGNLFESPFTVQFTVKNGLITNYLFLEDSYALVKSLEQ